MPAMVKMKDKQFDLAIVDPPFRDNHQPTQGMRNNNKKGGYTKGKDFTSLNWKKPTEQYFVELFRVSKEQIIWGANNFVLPEHKGFLIWRKIRISEDFTMSMAEYAFLSEGLGTVSKIFSHQPQRENGIHPCQKPVNLYSWILNRYAKENDKILDTHLGSGSIAIACYDMGYDLVGYEIDKDYFEAAKARLERHMAQGQLF